MGPAEIDVLPPYTIGDKEGYIEFITELREKLAKRNKGANTIVDDIFEEDGSNGGAHPLLVAKPGEKEWARWILIELRAANKGKWRWTTLALRKDNLFVKGFMNKDGKWFELPSQHADNDNSGSNRKLKLPFENGATTELQGWDWTYQGIMKLHNKDQVRKTLVSTRLGKAFAMRAVRRLSRYQTCKDENDEHLTRLSLAGLIVMICEAARMNPFLETIAGGWDGGAGLTMRLANLIWDWGSLSAALLQWRDSGRRTWPIKLQTQSLGYALASIHLVLDSDEVTGSGPTWVEIFALFANFHVVSVTVIDEGNVLHTIYDYEQEMEQVRDDQSRQQEQQEMEQQVQDDQSGQQQQPEMEQQVQDDQSRQQEKQETRQVPDDQSRRQEQQGTEQVPDDQRHLDEDEETEQVHAEQTQQVQDDQSMQQEQQETEQVKDDQSRQLEQQETEQVQAVEQRQQVPNNKPKKSNNAQVLSQDYECTEKDYEIIEYMKAARTDRLLVNIDDTLVLKKEMACLFQDDQQVYGDVLNAYIHLIRHKEQLQQGEGRDVYLENTNISSLLKRDGDPTVVLNYDDIISTSVGKYLHADMVFLPINIENVHWYLAVVDATKREIHVLDSMGPGRLGRQDLKATLRGLERWIELAGQKEQLYGNKWEDFKVASWPIKEKITVNMQKDSASCGLWMIKYMEYWNGTALSHEITQSDINKFRLKLAAVLWNSTLNKARVDVISPKMLSPLQKLPRRSQGTSSINLNPTSISSLKEMTLTKSKCISGYQSFAIKVIGDNGMTITKTFTWDSRKQGHDHDTEYVDRTIFVNLSSEVRSLGITWLAMSNAVEAKVEVKQRLLVPRKGVSLDNEVGGVSNDAAKEDDDGADSKKYAVNGEITAQIGGLEGHPIVLLKRAEKKAITLDMASMILPLDRPTVHVPHGTPLQIDMNGLRVTETCSSSSSQSMAVADKPSGSGEDDDGRNKIRRLIFPFGDDGEESRPTVAINGCQLEVKVTWPASTIKTVKMKPADVVYIVGDSKKKLTKFIVKVREAFADKDLPPNRTTWRQTRRPPHPAADDGQPPQRWIHIELRVEAAVSAEKYRWSTTLAIQDGKCYGAGFMNQSQVWYDLGRHGSSNLQQGRGDKLQQQALLLPPEYKSVHLGWGGGLSYKDILGVSDWDDVPVILNRAGLGKKGFAEKAVRMLSRYPDVEEDAVMSPKVALAGLTIMVCESARFSALHKYFKDNWDNDGTTAGRFSREQMKYIWSWGKISRALLLYKENGKRWPRDPRLMREGINGPEQDARPVAHLVFPIGVATTKQINVVYTIGDADGFATFIKKLRNMVLACQYVVEDLLDGHPDPVSSSTRNRNGQRWPVLAWQRTGQPARWIHIKLQEEEASTTLVVRDDDLSVAGFRNRNGIWYNLGHHQQSMLPPELSSAVDLGWPPLPRRRRGKGYRSILGFETKLGKDLATMAVRTLSSYDDPAPPADGDDVDGGGDHLIRLAIAGLTVMLCEAAKLEPLLDAVARNWSNQGTVLGDQLVGYITTWEDMSRALLECKDSGYAHIWPRYPSLESIEINSREDALDIIRLVHNA